MFLLLVTKKWWRRSHLYGNKHYQLDKLYLCSHWLHMEAHTICCTVLQEKCQICHIFTRNLIINSSKIPSLFSPTALYLPLLAHVLGCWHLGVKSKLHPSHCTVTLKATCVLLLPKLTFVCQCPQIVCLRVLWVHAGCRWSYCISPVI